MEHRIFSVSPEEIAEMDRMVYFIMEVIVDTTGQIHTETRSRILLVCKSTQTPEKRTRFFAEIFLFEGSSRDGVFRRVRVNQSGEGSKLVGGFTIAGVEFADLIQILQWRVASHLLMYTKGKWRWERRTTESDMRISMLPDYQLPLNSQWFSFINYRE